MQPGRPLRRRSWRRSAPIAVAIASLTLGAGVASASGGGGVGTPDPPVLTGVLCLERCADVREATVGSPGPAERPRARRRRRGPLRRRRRRPGRGGAERGLGDDGRGQGAGEGGVRHRAGERLRDRGRDAERPAAEDRRRGPDPHRRPVQAHRRRGDPPSDLLRRAASAARLVHLPGRRGHRRPGRGRRTARPRRSSTPSSRTTPSPAPATSRSGTGGRPTAPRRRAATTSSARQRRRRRDRRHGGLELRLPPLPLSRSTRRHTYGDGYGAGRGHQGQDVFAECGTPIHAARGGRVQAVDVQSAAGNYVVIDGKGTKVDTFYAHLIAPLAAARGRPGAHRPGDRQRRPDRQRVRAVTCTSRSGAGPGGTRAVTRCRASATCCTTGTPGAERPAPGRGRDPRGARRRLRPGLRGREAVGSRVRARQGAGQAGDRVLRRRARGAGPVRVQGAPAARRRRQGRPRRQRPRRAPLRRAQPRSREVPPAHLGRSARQPRRPGRRLL